MSPKCSIVEKDGELMLIALHTHFLPQQQYSRVAGKSAKLNNLEKVYKMPTLKEDKQNWNDNWLEKSKTQEI